MKFQRRGCCANRLREADNLFHRLALHVQRNQECGDLRVAALSGEDFRHHCPSLGALERLAVVSETMKDVSDHFRRSFRLPR